MYIPTCILVDEDDNIPSTDRKVSTLDFISDDVWNLTLPSEIEDKPKVVKFPELNYYNDEDYQLTKKGILMQAAVDGVTTKNSRYPRCEFRELNKDGSRASWDSKDVHELKLLIQVLELPPKKPEICICQVHDAEDDVFEIRYEKNQIVVEGDVLKSVIVPDKIGLNQDINISISIDNSKTIIKINKFELIFSFTKKNCYFKAGCYTQSNLLHDKTGKGKVLLKKLWVKH